MATKKVLIFGYVLYLIKFGHFEPTSPTRMSPWHNWSARAVSHIIIQQPKSQNPSRIERNKFLYNSALSTIPVWTKIQCIKQPSMTTAIYLNLFQFHEMTSLLTIPIFATTPTRVYDAYIMSLSCTHAHLCKNVW